MTVTISLGRLGLHRINRHGALKQLIHRGALIGFNGHTQAWVSLDGFAPLCPTLQAVGKD